MPYDRVILSSNALHSWATHGPSNDLQLQTNASVNRRRNHRQRYIILMIAPKMDMVETRKDLLRTILRRVVSEDAGAWMQVSRRRNQQM